VTIGPKYDHVLHTFSLPSWLKRVVSGTAIKGQTDEVFVGRYLLLPNNVVASPSGL
jgi:hypothetical protein